MGHALRRWQTLHAPLTSPRHLSVPQMHEPKQVAMGSPLVLQLHVSWSLDSSLSEVGHDVRGT